MWAEPRPRRSAVVAGPHVSLEDRSPRSVGGAPPVDRREIGRRRPSVVPSCLCRPEDSRAGSGMAGRADAPPVCFACPRCPNVTTDVNPYDYFRQIGPAGGCEPPGGATIEASAHRARWTGQASRSAAHLGRQVLLPRRMRRPAAHRSRTSASRAGRRMVPSNAARPAGVLAKERTVCCTEAAAARTIGVARVLVRPFRRQQVRPAARMRTRISRPVEPSGASRPRQRCSCTDRRAIWARFHEVTCSAGSSSSTPEGSKRARSTHPRRRDSCPS